MKMAGFNHKAADLVENENPKRRSCSLIPSPTTQFPLQLLLYGTESGWGNRRTISL